MNKLEERLQKDLMEAMKSKNEVKLSAIRSVKTAIQNEKTNGSYHELTDDDVVKIIQKQVKQRVESEEVYRSAGRVELADKEMNERLELENYLPKMLSDNELKQVIDSIFEDVKPTGMKDMGKIMKELSAKYPNQYDGKTASVYIKEKISLI